MIKKLVVGNWKMNTTLADASVLATLVRNQIHEVANVDVVLCPPSIWLQEVASVLEISAPHIQVGAQNCYPEEGGPYTGEVSVAMLKDLCHFVIVGHSERREHFNESDDFVSDKAQAVLRSGMIPIVCVGERTRASGSIRGVTEQLKGSIDGIRKEEYGGLVVAYEPIWSISTSGTGQIADPAYAHEVCQAIKEYVGENTRVLYGGSVDGHNAHSFTAQASIDGVLVGGASLKAREFVEIVKNVSSS